VNTITRRIPILHCNEWRRPDTLSGERVGQVGPIRRGRRFPVQNGPDSRPASIEHLMRPLR
jgi:hypothetical protein